MLFQGRVIKEKIMDQGTWLVKTGLAQMLKGGVIMDVVDAEQAKIAEDAGACAVMLGRHRRLCHP